MLENCSLFHTKKYCSIAVLVEVFRMCRKLTQFITSLNNKLNSNVFMKIRFLRFLISFKFVVVSIVAFENLLSYSKRSISMKMALLFSLVVIYKKALKNSQRGKIFIISFFSCFVLKVTRQDSSTLYKSVTV